MKKTVEEYNATAALLDMRYSPSSHTFWKTDDYIGSDNQDSEIDADTFEPVTTEEIAKRIMEKMR